MLFEKIQLACPTQGFQRKGKIVSWKISHFSRNFFFRNHFVLFSHFVRSQKMKKFSLFSRNFASIYFAKKCENFAKKIMRIVFASFIFAKKFAKRERKFFHLFAFFRETFRSLETLVLPLPHGFVTFPSKCSCFSYYTD